MAARAGPQLKTTRVSSCLPSRVDMGACRAHDYICTRRGQHLAVRRAAGACSGQEPGPALRSSVREWSQACPMSLYRVQGHGMCVHTAAHAKISCIGVRRTLYAPKIQILSAERDHVCSDALVPRDFGHWMVAYIPVCARGGCDMQV